MAFNNSKQMQIASLEIKYLKLLEFARKLAENSCCAACECNACDATEVLREIGEL